jgi:hypothetical protein
MASLQPGCLAIEMGAVTLISGKIINISDRITLQGGQARIDLIL